MAATKELAIYEQGPSCSGTLPCTGSIMFLDVIKALGDLIGFQRRAEEIANRFRMRFELHE